MGKIKDAVQDWLEDYGHALGYDMSNPPSLSDLKDVLDNQIDAQSYWSERK